MTDQMIEERTGVDRREALKKAAMAAGVVAWTTPVVQAVLPGHASATTAMCTGCRLTSGLTFTGANCACLPGVCASCCNAQTVLGFADCGPAASCGQVTVSGCILIFLPTGPSSGPNSGTPGWYEQPKDGCPEGLGGGNPPCVGFPSVVLGDCSTTPKLLWVNLTVSSTTCCAGTSIMGFVTVAGCLDCGGVLPSPTNVPPAGVPCVPSGCADTPCPSAQIASTVETPAGEAWAQSTWDVSGNELGHVSVGVKNLSDTQGSFVVTVVGPGGSTGQPDEGQNGSVTLAPGATTYVGFFVAAGTWSIHLDGVHQSDFQINQS